MNTYKLHIKIGENEFNSEGPAEIVKEAFDTWRELIASMPSKPTVSKEGRNNSKYIDPDNIEPERLNRLFLYDPTKDLMSVRIFPRGTERERDTLLLILLGYKVLKDKHEVMATKLTRSMRQSGCKVTRVDRLAAKYINQGLVNKGGMAKSGHYSLTNTGLARAIEIMDEILG